MGECKPVLRRPAKELHWIITRIAQSGKLEAKSGSTHISPKEIEGSKKGKGEEGGEFVCGKSNAVSEEDAPASSAAPTFIPLIDRPFAVQPLFLTERDGSSFPSSLLLDGDAAVAGRHQPKPKMIEDDLDSYFFTAELRSGPTRSCPLPFGMESGVGRVAAHGTATALLLTRLSNH